ncbi:MAG: hypothetical protein JRF65_08540 [Deltaproteobacteria bacterium]|nr:hypothetical protein [Deltaproteobacteria bacterium]
MSTSHCRRRGAVGIFLFFSALVFLLAGPACGRAGTISMETRTETEVSGHLLKVTVIKTNKGTAPAFQVRTRIAALDEKLVAPVKDRLNPEESYADQFDVDIASLGKGRFPVIVHTDFHDANRYPFSGLSVTTFRVGEDTRADIIVWGEDVNLGNAGNVRISLKNLTASPLDIRARLYAPREINVSRPDEDLLLAARSESDLDFYVSNFSALVNARYPIYCVAEYDSGGVHHAEIARLHMTIGARANFFRRYRHVWATLAGALCALLIVALLWGRRKKDVTTDHTESTEKI